MEPKGTSEQNLNFPLLDYGSVESRQALWAFVDKHLRAGIMDSSHTTEVNWSQAILLSLIAGCSPSSRFIYV